MKPSDQLRTAAYYAQHAHEYFERTNGVEMGGVYEPFDRQLRPSSRILDLGCGSGRDARHFAARGHQVVAVDPCAELLDLAIEHTPAGLRSRIQFLMGAAPNLPFVDGEFDAIWACASLLHLPRETMPHALAECRRVMRPERILFVAAKENDPTIEDDERSFTLWNADELRLVVESAGLQMINVARRQSLEKSPVTWVDVLAAKHACTTFA